MSQKIIEFFSINNEWDLLELHLQEHDKWVNQFVITESNRNFQQQPRELLWEKYKDRFTRWQEKITYLPFDADGLEPGWPTEQAQRRFAFDKIDCALDTVFLITDVDEIMRPEDWCHIKEFTKTYARELLFSTECYYCFANYRYRRRQLAIAVTTKEKFIDPTLHRRPQHEKDTRPFTMMKNGGLHLTWFGNKEMFIQKMSASIEGVLYKKQTTQTVDELWKHKQQGSLFSFLLKFKRKKFEIIDIESNASFSQNIKDFIKLHPEWVLDYSKNS